MSTSFYTSLVLFSTNILYQYGIFVNRIMPYCYNFIMLGNQIKFYRKTNKLTQQEIADKLNITQACYNRYEKGIREPDIETLKKLCVIFDCTSDELLEIDTTSARSKVLINNSFNNSKNINLKL